MTYLARSVYELLRVVSHWPCEDGPSVRNIAIEGRVWGKGKPVSVLLRKSELLNVGVDCSSLQRPRQ